MKMRQEIPDCQIKDAADQFMNAWRLLEDKPPGSGVLLPLINTAAVAIELYLKCLSSKVIHTQNEKIDSMFLVSAKPQQRGHTLVNIFKKIPEEYRLQITEKYTSSYCDNYRNFEAVLESLEGAFQESRYPFEKDYEITKFKLNDIRNICLFLSSYVGHLEVKETVHW